METPLEIRIDKWLWSVRVYKTRSQATAACRGGAVEIGGQKVKPSHVARPQQIITARVGDLLRTVKVLGLLDRRVSAAVAREYCEDLTPAAEYLKPREPDFRPLMFRTKGLGRPTKRDRREIERTLDSVEQQS